MPLLKWSHWQSQNFWRRQPTPNNPTPHQTPTLFRKNNRTQHNLFKSATHSVSLPLSLQTLPSWGQETRCQDYFASRWPRRPCADRMPRPLHACQPTRGQWSHRGGATTWSMPGWGITGSQPAATTASGRWHCQWWQRKRGPHQSPSLTAPVLVLVLLLLLLPIAVVTSSFRYVTKNLKLYGFLFQNLVGIQWIN